MSDVLVVLVLVAHGLVHAAIYLMPAPANGRPQPFDPEHSWALGAVHSAHDTEAAVARSLAATAAVGMIVAGLAYALGSAMAPMLAVSSAVIGLVLKGLYFNRWLIVGMLLDLAIIAVVLAAAG